MKTTAEVWLAKVNAKLPSPIAPGSLEDELAYDSYVSGKSAKATADLIISRRAAPTP